MFWHVSSPYRSEVPPEQNERQRIPWMMWAGWKASRVALADASPDLDTVTRMRFSPESLVDELRETAVTARGWTVNTRFLFQSVDVHVTFNLF